MHRVLVRRLFEEFFDRRFLFLSDNFNYHERANRRETLEDLHTTGVKTALEVLHEIFRHSASIYFSIYATADLYSVWSRVKPNPWLVYSHPSGFLYIWDGLDAQWCFSRHDTFRNAMGFRHTGSR